MKIRAILYLAILVLAAGSCSREKSQVGTMIWPGAATNCQLSVTFNHSVITTNVDSLESAANFLGQYGWLFASENLDGGDRAFYMKRQYQGNDTSVFALVPVGLNSTN